MKKSVFITIPILFFIAFSFSSCSKDGLFKTIEERIEGEWEYEEVKFRKNLSLSKEDVSEDFSDLSFEFNSEYETFQSNGSSNEVIEGSWDVIRSNGEGAADRLSIVLVDFENESTQLINWDLQRVTDDKIKAREEKDGGTYFYHLVKR